MLRANDQPPPLLDPLPPQELWVHAWGWEGRPTQRRTLTIRILLVHSAAPNSTPFSSSVSSWLQLNPPPAYSPCWRSRPRVACGVAPRQDPTHAARHCLEWECPSIPLRIGFGTDVLIRSPASYLATGVCIPAIGCCVIYRASWVLVSVVLRPGEVWHLGWSSGIHGVCLPGRRFPLREKKLIFILKPKNGGRQR